MGLTRSFGHVPHAHLAAPVIGVYRCGVAKRLAVTDEERREVCRSALAALASGALDDFTSGSRTLDDKRFPFPADAFTELGADALALAVCHLTAQPLRRAIEAAGTGRRS